MALGGASAQQILELQLRVTAQTTGAIQASQALAQLEKQGDRTAANLTRAFGPRLITSMSQARAQAMEQGRALVELGANLQGNIPIVANLGERLSVLGQMQLEAGLTGKGLVQVTQQQAAVLQEYGQRLQQAAG